jgi:hypothetical protein
MKYPEVEIYLNQFMVFFKKNPNDLSSMIGNSLEEIFFEKVREKSILNFKNGEDVTLTRKQILDIVVDLKTPSKTENGKINDIIFNTKFGDIILN